MCIVINDFSGFTQYMLFIQGNESGLFGKNNLGWVVISILNLSVFLKLNSLVAV